MILYGFLSAEAVVLPRTWIVMSVSHWSGYSALPAMRMCALCVSLFLDGQAAFSTSM